MQRLPPDFAAAKQKNLAYTNAYGAERSVHAPHWAGAEGDIVAQTRMAWPSPGLQKYLNGPTYNQFAKNFVHSALQGEARSMGDTRRLTGGDDYTPQIGRKKYAQATEYPQMKKIDGGDDGCSTEVILATVVILGIVGFLFVMNRR